MKGTNKQRKILAHILNSPYLCSVIHRNHHDDGAAKRWWKQKLNTMIRKPKTRSNSMERVSYAQEHLLRRIVEKRQAQFVHRHFGRSEDLLTKYMVLKGTSERLATTDSEWFQIERNQCFSRNVCMTEKAAVALHRQK